MKTLARHVHVHDEDGVSHVFGPGDDLPGWARKAITNPKAWASDEPAPEPAPEPEPEPASGEPPRNGPGSNVFAWTTYAESLGIEVPAGAQRVEIIELVDASK